MPIRLRLALYISLILIILLSLSYYGTYTQSKLLKNLDKIHTTSSNLIHLTEQLDNNFQKQLLAWTNLLLRGQEPTEYHIYLTNFYQQERTTRNEIKSLSNKLNQYIDAKNSSIKFIEAHSDLGLKFRQAIKIFNQSTTPAYDADQFIWDSIALPVELLSEIKENILLQQKVLLSETEAKFNSEQYILIFVYLFLALSFIFLFLWFIDVNLGRPLTKTTNIAKNISHGDYSQRLNEKLPGEFDLFAQAFNKMMDHISETNHDLVTNMHALKDEIKTRKNLEKELKQKRLLAEDASKTKSEFLSTMSHEIRTPLNVVTGYIELLGLTDLSEEQQGYIKSIQTGSSSLLTLINDILDFAKIESGKLNIDFNAVSTSDLLADITNMFSLTAAEKDIQFKVTSTENVPESIVSDYVRLKQILVNLLSNAIKFTEQGYVHLFIDATPSSDSSRVNLIFKVEDSGIGIHENYIDKIFNHFEQQSGQDSRKYGGTGLGLAICKNLSLLLNGELSVASITNMGSTFTLNLFEVEVPESDLHTHTQKEKTVILLNAATILIADDMKANRTLVKDCLRNHPIEFIEAENGKEAVRMAKQYHPDLILMDIKMPEMDGIEATTILREDDESANIPIIALSASSIQEDDTELKQTLFNEYLTKPLQLKLLLEKLNIYLSSK